MKKKQLYNLGLALSGGGSRGFAHLAALKAMNERGISPEILSGTSAGSLAAAFYADGYEPENVLTLFKEMKLRRFFETNIPRDGLFKTSRFATFLEKHLHARTFEELKIPLRVVASDIEEGKAKIFHKGELIPALVASCCVPIVFTPILIDGHYYIDGGIFSNFPVSIIRDECKTLLGVNVSPIITMQYNKSIKYIIERTMNYAIGANTIEERKKCDYLIESNKLSAYSMFDLDKADEIYQKGYRLASSYLDKHDEMLKRELSKSTFEKWIEKVKL